MTNQCCGIGVPVVYRCYFEVGGTQFKIDGFNTSWKAMRAKDKLLALDIRIIKVRKFFVVEGRFNKCTDASATLVIELVTSTGCISRN